MGAAEAMAVIVVGGIAVVGILWFMNNQRGANVETLVEDLFPGRGGMKLKNVPEGYSSSTLDKIRDSTFPKLGPRGESTAETSQFLNDYVEGIRESIGANAAIRAMKGYRSNMAIHYE